MQYPTITSRRTIMRWLRSAILVCLWPECAKAMRTLALELRRAEYITDISPLLAPRPLMESRVRTLLAEKDAATGTHVAWPA